MESRTEIIGALVATLVTFLTLVFVLLKQLNIIKWSWIWVFCPIWIYFATALFLAIIALIIVIIINKD